MLTVAVCIVLAVSMITLRFKKIKFATRLCWTLLDCLSRFSANVQEASNLFNIKFNTSNCPLYQEPFFFGEVLNSQTPGESKFYPLGRYVRSLIDFVYGCLHL